MLGFSLFPLFLSFDIYMYIYTYLFSPSRLALLLCRGVRLPPPTMRYPDMTLNNLIVRFQLC